MHTTTGPSGSLIKIADLMVECYWAIHVAQIPRSNTLAACSEFFIDTTIEENRARMNSWFNSIFSNNASSFNLFNNYNVTSVADEKSTVLQWLSPLEPQKRHQGVSNRRLEGTGHWFLETAEFQKWCKAEDGSVPSTLFCSGDPGAGKTHISSLVIDTLCDQFSGKDVGVACLYCDFHAQEEQMTTSMMGGILKQLVAALDEIPEEIGNAFQKSKESLGGRELRLPDILKLLAKILASFRRTFICIDGLDEYAVERRPEFLRSLQQVLRDSPTTRLFVAGRPHLKGEVKKHLSESVPHLAIKPHESDIKKYINKKISEDLDSDAMSGELESEIITRISESSSDIFLLVALKIDAILGETSIHRRRQKLHQEENGLHEVYAATLDRMSRQRGDKPRLGMEVLLWVSLAKRPLSVSELCDALGVEIGSTDLNAENTPSIQTLLGSCLGLVTVDKETSRVRLIHSTLQEYLQAHTTLFGNGHAKIAEVCLTYLNFSAVKALPLSMGTPPANMPFLIYASYHWGYHAGKQMTESLKMRALSFLKDYDHVSVNVIGSRPGINPGFREEGSLLWEYLYHYVDSVPLVGCPMPGLHCAVLFGLDELVSSLMELKSTDINQQDFYGMTPLAHAVRCGSHSIFTLLLSDPNIRADISDEDGITPLFLAADWGHEMMLERLLTMPEVSPDAKSSSLGTPLHIAAFSGRANIVKLLLSRSDVDPNSKTSLGNTPFLHASIAGEGGTAKLFLNLDNFDPNIANNDGRTSLSFAAEFGHIGIVEMLLAMDNIDLNPVDEDSNTPILWAAAGAGYGEIVKGDGRGEIVKLLLDCKGINRNQVNNKGHTLLHMAVKGGREEVVMLLLERGESDLNARDLSGATPLELAVQYEHDPMYNYDYYDYRYEGIVRLLKAAQTHYSGPTGAKSSTSVGY